MNRCRVPALGLLALTVLVSALVLAQVPARAASEILTMTPTSVHPSVKPGASVTGKFQVVNQGQDSLQVRIYAAPYSVKSEDYTPDFTPLPGKPNVSSWLQFSIAHAQVKPNQALTVHYTLRVPQNTQPGGYYAVAFAQTELPKTSRGVVVNEQVGEIFYIRVPGPVRQAGKLLSWSSPFLQKPPLTAVLRLENDGGVDYDSNIQIAVRDIFGNPKYILDTQKEILPQTIRRIPVVWTKAPALSLFKVGGTYTVFGKRYALPPHYVLVASPLVRWVFLVALAAFVVLGGVRAALRNKSRSRPKPKGE